eukprot:g7792.t1
MGNSWEDLVAQEVEALIEFLEDEHARCLGTQRATNISSTCPLLPRHPELKGHVQAEETRDFWRDPHFSPSAQAYHWGHNAESYWLIGQAMGTGMLAAMQ